MRRLRLLGNADFIAAVFFWCLGRLLRLQVHWVLATPLSGTGNAQGGSRTPPERPTFRVLRTEGDLAALPCDIEHRLNEQSGPSCRKLIEAGDRVYAAIDGDRLACQLNLRSGTIRVDSPALLAFHFAPDDVFLNYLYTRDEYRARGLAGALIRFACNDAAASGKKRCLCHVRATNSASVRAFRRAGWRIGAMILTTRAGRFLAAPGCRRIGMHVEPLKPDGSSVSAAP